MTVKAQEVLDAVAFTMDGVRYRVWKSEDATNPQGPSLRTLTQHQKYVGSRVARCNGHRLDGMGLTIEFMPGVLGEHDTSIESGLSVGHDVFIAPHAVIGEGVTLGNNVQISYWCTLGNHVTVESDVEIGASNTLPDFVTVRAGTKIPDDTFPPGAIPRCGEITQAYVDDVIQCRIETPASRGLTVLRF